ncbi:MAG: hypothetical protein HS111_01075 [Kofleriaceae bacterium]|nr:hypothetical protein [Kofleriaceae bacterium]
MVTSRGERIDRVIGFDAGARTSTSTKPSHRQLLLRAVRKFLGHAGGDGAARTDQVATEARRERRRRLRRAGAGRAVRRPLTPLGFRVAGAASAGELLARVDELAPRAAIVHPSRARPRPGRPGERAARPGRAGGG